MITLSLLHPLKQIPVQVWPFENESVIRIGRSTDNQVILYSAVVSRHHAELRRVGASWEVVNLGTNGTYLDGKRITQAPIVDGAIIRLARSGPNIKIRMGTEALKDLPETLAGDRTIGQRPDHLIVETEVTSERAKQSGFNGADEQARQAKATPSTGTIPVPPHLQLPVEPKSGAPVLPASIAEVVSTATAFKTLKSSVSVLPPTCKHRRGGSLFCLDCGQPLQVLQTVEDYQLVKVLGQGEIGITYLAWQEGRNLALKTLNPDWVHNSKAQAAFECEVDILRQLNHPKVPHLIDFFSIAEQPYLVMELMPGQSLAQQIATAGPVSTSKAIAWLLDLCKILEYLHTFTPPLLHRGIKPANLIQQHTPYPFGEIALVDFGAIKALALGKDTAAGFAGYAAPERLKINATSTVDLYALGPTLAYLLTGQNPASFYGDRDQGYRFHADLVPGLSPEIATVIQTLTHPQPERRYPSASALAEALRQVPQMYQ